MHQTQNMSLNIKSEFELMKNIKTELDTYKRLQSSIIKYHTYKDHKIQLYMVLYGAKTHKFQQMFEVSKIYLGT